MPGCGARRQRGDDLYERIGDFLAEQRLSSDPAHYAFAHNVLSNPDSPVTRAIARLSEDGVRLSRHDIERFGGAAVLGASSDRAEGASATDGPGSDPTASLVAETQAQVDGFALMMRAMRDETRGFGRDLAHSADEIIRTPRDDAAITGIDEIARITGAMLGRIRDAEVRLAQATSEADALRAKLAEANDRAHRDTLTGLPNRRAFDEAFAERDFAAGPYCLALCDIDRFKRINDQHGHAVGDRVLSAVARTLAEECSGHLVVRHGGEEFAILLAGLALADAAAKLDKVREVISAKRFRNRETDCALGQITISIGITAVHPNEHSATPFDRADQLLYSAKADGRDRVCAA